MEGCKFIYITCIDFEKFSFFSLFVYVFFCSFISIVANVPEFAFIVLFNHLFCLFFFLCIFVITIYVCVILCEN